MIKKVLVFIFFVIALNPAYTQITISNGDIISRVPLDAGVSGGSPIAKNIAINEINEYINPAVSKLVDDYINSKDAKTKPYYEDALDNIKIVYYNTGIKFEVSNDNKYVIASINENYHANALFSRIKTQLDEEVSDVLAREERMKNAMIEGASDEDNKLLADAAYYVYEYEKGRIAKDNNSPSTVNVVRKLGLNDALLKAYIIAAAKQVEQAPAYVKNIVVQAAATRYLYQMQKALSE